MSNRNKQFEKQMRQFLKAIANNERVDYEDPNIRHCVYECVHRGYVTGYHHCACTTDNTIVFNHSNPRVEKAGYDFLYPKIDWVSIGTLIASIITAIGVLLQLVLSIG